MEIFACAANSRYKLEPILDNLRAVMTVGLQVSVSGIVRRRHEKFDAIPRFHGLLQHGWRASFL